MKKVMMIVGTGALMAIAPLTFTSCGKKGCTDKDAENYCSECKKDDGSCTYEGSVQFWYNQSTSQYLVNNDITGLEIYVDGELIGSYATTVYFTSAPNCSESSVVRKTKDLGKSKSASGSYVVKDSETGTTLWQGSFTYQANTCINVQLKQ